MSKMKTICKNIAFSESGECLMGAECTCEKNKKWLTEEESDPLPEEREPVYRWVKIDSPLPEPPKMPEIDEPVLWRRQDGNYFVSEIDKDDYDWWNGRQTKDPLKDGYDARVEGTKCTHWTRIHFQEIPVPIPQPVSKETESAYSDKVHHGEVKVNASFKDEEAAPSQDLANEKSIQDAQQLLKSAPPIPESLPTEVQCPNCLGEGTEVLSEFGPETCRCCGGLKSVAMDTWEYWTKEYGGNPIPTPVSSKMEHTEMPDGYGIVYDKVFIPCKQGVGEDYPSSICDFDYNKQKWVPGDFFIKPVPGPVAVIPAKHYEVLQASLSSIKAERDEARQLSFLISRDVEAFRAERDLYRTESEAHKKAKEEPKP